MASSASGCSPFLGAVALMPVIGWAVAVVGSRTMTIVAAFAFAAALLLPGLAPNLSLFVAAALLAGACNGTMDIAMNTNATVVERAWGAAIMSSFHAFFSLGGLAGRRIGPAHLRSTVGIVADACDLLPRHGAGLPLAAFGTLGERERMARRPWLRLAARAVILLAVLAMFCFIVEGAIVDWSAIYLQTVTGASLEDRRHGLCRFLARP